MFFLKINGGSMNMFPHTLFVTGSDTDVGKTFVSAVITLGLEGYYWKPIQCGVSPCTDTEWVQERTGLPSSHFLKESYRFGEPISPHAQHTGVDIESLKPERLPGPDSHLVIEGSGGVMVPLNEKEFFVDFMVAMAAPTLLVIKNSKGAVNQALLTTEKLKEKGVPLFGIVLNGPKNKINREAIEQYCNPPRLFEMDFISKITKDALKKVFLDTFTESLCYA